MPLDGVQVLDVFGGKYVLTSPTGTANLAFVTYRGFGAMVELRKLGFQPKQLFVSRADTSPITEVMEPVVELAPVLTTERYRIDLDAGRWEGFEQRCQSKSVTCFRPEDVAKYRGCNVYFSANRREVSITFP